uniref:uncharacterized protein LOC122783115 n=1 Tax=Solea senegalensis TaxID=28829 RepID=UPI001CD8E0F1|nr:uncharacterized protein LOC122783115 [Solea senegalensis]
MPQLYPLTCLVLTIPASTSPMEQSYTVLKRIKMHARNWPLPGRRWTVLRGDSEGRHALAKILAMKLTVFLTLITHMEKQVHLSFLIFLLWTKGLTDGSDVTQTSILWKDMGDNATIHCKHTKGINYYQMYWYRQLPGEMMKQIVFTTTTTTEHKYESGFSKDKFPAQKSDANTGSLTVEKLQPEDSGLYFCSVSQHSDAGDSGSCTKTQLLVTGKRKEDNGLFDRVQMALWI